MAIDNRYNYKSSAEQRIFKKGEIAVSDQSNPTDKSKAHQEAVYRHAPRVYREVDRQVHLVDQDATEAAYRERNNEVDRMVTEADFERRLPNQDASTSQGRVPMITGCKIYSTEHAEALHRSQTAQARLNLVSMTILEKLTC